MSNIYSLHRFARNDYFCQNSPKILKTDQFPYISPLCSKYTVSHCFARNDYFCQNYFIILKSNQFPYISPLCRKSIFQFWNGWHFWDFPDHKNFAQLHEPSTLCSRWNQNVGHGANEEAMLRCSNGGKIIFWMSQCSAWYIEPWQSHSIYNSNRFWSWVWLHKGS